MKIVLKKIISVPICWQIGE